MGAGNAWMWPYMWDGCSLLHYLCVYHCGAPSVLCGIEKITVPLIWLPEMGPSIVDLLLLQSSLVRFGSKEIYTPLNGIRFTLSPVLLLSLLIYRALEVEEGCAVFMPHWGWKVTKGLVLPIRRKLSDEMSSDSFVELRKCPHVPDSTLAANGKYSSVLGTTKKDKILCFGWDTKLHILKFDLSLRNRYLKTCLSCVLQLMVQKLAAFWKTVFLFLCSYKIKIITWKQQNNHLFFPAAKKLWV